MMQALPRHSRDANSTPSVEVSIENSSTAGDPLPAEEFCPLKHAIREKLHAVGASVSEVQQYLLSGDLKNAEHAFDNIIGRLREQFCPTDPVTCNWVREGHQDTGCDLLRNQSPLYLLPASSPRDSEDDASHSPKSSSNSLVDCDYSPNAQDSYSTSDRLKELLEQALRF